MEIADLTDKTVTIILSLGGAWAVMKWRQDRFDKDFERHEKDVWSQIDQLLAKAHEQMKIWYEHDKDSAQKRLEIANQINDLKVVGAKVDERHTAIMNILEEIRADIAKLQNAKEK